MVNSPGLRQALRRLGFAVFIVVALGTRLARGDEMQEANKLLKAGEYQQALAQVDKILASRPNDPQARFLKGVILTEQGDDKAAVAVFSALTRDYPDLPEPYNNLAVIYASQGEYEKAREALVRSIRTHPSYATAYENLGDVYATLAGRAYDKALQIDSTNSTAKHKLALMHQLIGGPPGSIKEARNVAMAATPSTAPSAAAVHTAPNAPVAADRALPVSEPANRAQPNGDHAKPERTMPAEAKPAPENVERAASAENATAEARPAATVAAAAPPAASPAKQVSVSGDTGEAAADTAIVNTVESWAKAWSRKDVDAYLAFYAEDFETPKGRSRQAWEAQRRERLTAPKSISVTIASPQVRIAASGQASVTFRQTYSSNIVHSTTLKTLVLEPSDGHWLIRQERVGRK
jgi:Flp pilus assembly protein TadD/ketosteroid isomerase-like protein